MVLNKVEPVPEVNQLNLPCWDPKCQFSSLWLVWACNLSKAKVLLEPNQTQVLPPGCWAWEGNVLWEHFLMGLALTFEKSLCDPDLCSMGWYLLFADCNCGGRLWSDQTIHVCFPEFPCSPLCCKHNFTISPEVSKTQSLQPWQVSDNQKYDTVKEKKRVCFHYLRRIKCKKQANCIMAKNILDF